MSEIIIEKNPTSFSFSELQNIFWETSARKDFNSEGEKEKFFYQYFKLYLDHYAEYLCVAKHIQTSHLVGYCLGSPETDLDLFFNAQPYLVLFKDLYSQFPAHLHINFSSHYQGKGLGSKLLSAFEENLSSKKISGLHIMTASSARNVQFYRKMGFHLEVERPWGRGHILFMGKELKSK